MTQAELKGVRLFGDSSRLTPLVFEDVLLRAGLLRKGDEFSVDVERVGALIDLSKIEWVDFSVVAELCLLVHRIAAAGIRVEVLLPDRRDAANAAILSVADLKRPGGDGSLDVSASSGFWSTSGSRRPLRISHKLQSG